MAVDTNLETYGGYTVGYGREKGQFRVFVMVGIGIVLGAIAFTQGSELLLALSVAALGTAFYFFPLIETGKPRIGANQYGIFIEGFGLVGWRSIRDIDVVTVAVRSIMTHELQIKLAQPLPGALLADWRKVPFYRLLMRQPWTMTDSNVVRINLEPFADPPDEIHRTLLRMWRYYRS